MKKIVVLALAGTFLLAAVMIARAQEKPTPSSPVPQATDRAERLKARLDSLPQEVKDALPERLKRRIAGRLGGKPGDQGPYKQFALLHADGVAMNREGATVDARTQKGTIEQVSQSSITLKSADGYTRTYAIDGDTRIREKGRPGDASDLKQSKMATVFAVKQGDGYVAKMIGYAGEHGPRRKAALDG